LDTSGAGLHKRGYRPVSVVAPLRETLAAAMVSLAKYSGKGALYDPFCGSGTIAIEAALAAKNRAPGINRSFAAEKWPRIPKKIWEDERKRAMSREYSGEYDIVGADIDPRAVETATENARRAGVSNCVRFIQADAREFSQSAERGSLVTNPPFGERIMEKKQAEALYRDFGASFLKTAGWAAFILSSHTEFERAFGKTADKKRKLYNGMIKCELYMYDN
jgi:putative N6-adenine-specific DNA methylase